MGFGQWHSPYKGENWAQSLKSWKCDVLAYSSGLSAPTSSFPEPKIFLRMCLTIACSMAGSFGWSLGPKNGPQSRKKRPKWSKITLFWKKLKISFVREKWPLLLRSEAPDTYFRVKITIFRGLGWHLAVLGWYLCILVLMVWHSVLLILPILQYFQLLY